MLIAELNYKLLFFNRELSSVFLSLENIERLMQLVLANEKSYEKMGEYNILKLAAQIE